MPETRQKAPAKTYLCKYKDFSTSFPIDNGGLDTLRFVNGEFTTEFSDEQTHLEGLPTSAGISVKPGPRAALEAKAKELRAVAVEANSVAKAAEDALADFDKKAEPVKAPAKPAVV